MSHDDKPPAGNQATLVREWFLSYYDDALSGIEDFEGTDEGVLIVLRNPLSLAQFKNALEGHEIEDPQSEQTTLTVKEVEDGEGVHVYEEQLQSNGAVSKFKVGTTYREEDEIHLTGSRGVMWPEGDPKGEVVKDVLTHLKIYLSSRYR